jgi:5-methylcytosine-specific restriction endonuclease McrA
MKCEDIIPLADARSRGLKRYFTGQPCKRGHLCDRFTSSRACVECLRASVGEWRINNAEHLVNYRKNYFSDNREAISEKRKASRPARRDRLNAVTRKWRAENLDRVLKYSRDYYNTNKAEMAEYHSEWCKNNALKCRLYVAKRRAQEFGSFSEEDIQEIMKQQRGKCAFYKICGNSLKKKYDIDHIVAISNGGSSFRSNLQLLCQSCNRSKSNKDPIVFSQQRGMLL